MQFHSMIIIYHPTFGERDTNNCIYSMCSFKRMHYCAHVIWKKSESIIGVISHFMSPSAPKPSHILKLQLKVKRWCLEKESFLVLDSHISCMAVKKLPEFPL